MENIKVAIVGLGYVGLPLALALAKHRSIVGYDIDSSKITAINGGKDPNGELEDDAFHRNDFTATNDISLLSDCNFFIVAVPTPITKNKVPYLEPLKSATESIGSVLKKGDVVVYESTVFPGCTEEICVPILEKKSGLKYLEDFKIGYSPERINPGDKVHKLQNTVKIVSACDEETLNIVSNLYEEVVQAGVFKAKSIKVAEAAKIIENVQRDVNIALMNELSLIFDKMEVNTMDVIEAASTKWNFMKFYPGLVGGHCISVDPYYLTYKAIELGYYPEVILSGRRVNNKISNTIAKKLVQHISRMEMPLSESRVLILGLTFKENVGDFRNTKVFDLINELRSFEVSVDVMDPYIQDRKEFNHLDFEVVNHLTKQYDSIIFTVKHDEFTKYPLSYYESYLTTGGVFLDIKSVFLNQIPTKKYWSL